MVVRAEKNASDVITLHDVSKMFLGPNTSRTITGLLIKLNVRSFV